MKLNTPVRHPNYPGRVGRFTEEERSDHNTRLAVVVWEKEHGKPIGEAERQSLGCVFPVRELEAI